MNDKWGGGSFSVSQCQIKQRWAFDWSKAVLSKAGKHSSSSCSLNILTRVMTRAMQLGVIWNKHETRLKFQQFDFPQVSWIPNPAFISPSPLIILLNTHPSLASRFGIALACSSHALRVRLGLFANIVPLISFPLMAISQSQWVKYYDLCLSLLQASRQLKQIIVDVLF